MQTIGSPIRIPATLVATLVLAAACDRGPTEPPVSRVADRPPAAGVFPADVEPCGTPLESALLAGQDLEIGSVTIANDDESLYVTVTTTGGWTLRATQLDVASSVQEIETNGQGNPTPGRFERQAKHDDATSYTYELSLADLGVDPAAGDELVVALHAEVYLAAEQRTEGAWGAGTPFTPGASWATYAEYAVQACAVVLAPDELCSEHGDDAIATFADERLDLRVHFALREERDADLTCGDLATLQILAASNYFIRDLTGIQNLVSLRNLFLSGNRIADVEPLSHLTGLKLLDLDGNSVRNLGPIAGLTGLTSLVLADNGITDAADIGGLTGLTYLELARNSVTDLSPLSSLVELEHLGLNKNGLSDISPIAGLPHLKRVVLNVNQISDVSPLRDLVELEFVGLGSNPLSDVEPLIDNPGLGGGDTVILRNTLVSCTDVGRLEGEGITVLSDCP